MGTHTESTSHWDEDSSMGTHTISTSHWVEEVFFIRTCVIQNRHALNKTCQRDLTILRKTR